MESKPDLVFPVLTDVPPLPPIGREAYLRLVTEARDLVRDRAALERELLKEDIPVRFRLPDDGKRPA